MSILTLFSSLPAAALLFAVSLGVVIAASARFTRKLEELCETFNFSIGILSLLSALGANIPNYVSSVVAIMGGHTDVGIGIILGSNIYNIAIILGLCTLVTPERRGLTLGMPARRDVGVIAWYALAITLSAGIMSALLPGSPFVGQLHATQPTQILFLLANVLIFAIFGGLFGHILRRSHGQTGTTLAHHTQLPRRTTLSLARLIGEVLFTLVIALGGVLVMVQAGQTLTSDLHMPSILAGLLVLAVATSLPNTIVAVSLVRTGEAAACVEEICSSASINIVLGVALPVMLWPGLIQDRFLLLLDGPFLLALTFWMLFGIVRGHLNRGMGLVLLGLYVAWVVIRFLV